MAVMNRVYGERLKGIKKPNLSPPAYCWKHQNPWYYLSKATYSELQMVLKKIIRMDFAS